MRKNTIIIFFSCLCFIIFATQEAHAFSFRVFVTSLFIQVFSIYNIFNNEKIPFSLDKIFYLFSFFFFGIAPIVQFYENADMWGRTLNEEQYFLMNIVVILILACYNLCYKIFFKSGKTTKEKQKKNFIDKLVIQDELTIKQTAVLVGISLLAFLVVFQFNNFSFNSLLVRAGEMKEFTSESAENSTTQSLIVNNFFKPMAMMCLLYYIYIPKKNKFVLIFLLVNTLVTCFPLGMARFATAALYIPFLFLIFPFLRKKNVFSLIFMAGLLILFPLLNNFRNIISFDDIEIKMGFDLEMFAEGHYDSYANAAQVILNDFTTNGKQLLGVIFFWVPRSIWPSKPIGSGTVVAEKMGFYFDNVSVNYFAEGYINFGFFGLFLFLVLLAYATAKLDYYFWTEQVNNRKNIFFVVYLILLGLLFFILRGALISAFAYAFGFVFAFFVVFYSMKYTRMIDKVK